jgi:uncharacterized membrane protein (UPF0127 family)
MATAMHRATVDGRVLADRLRPAHTHWTRLRGLLGTLRLDPGEGLWIKPCNQVHMLGMRYAIDIVFLDEAGRVLRVVHTLRPNRISPRVKGATSVLELPAGTLTRVGLTEGTRVEIERAAEPALANGSPLAPFRHGRPEGPKERQLSREDRQRA